jgi:hypothetical protein
LITAHILGGLSDERKENIHFISEKKTTIFDISFLIIVIVIFLILV